MANLYLTWWLLAVIYMLLHPKLDLKNRLSIHLFILTILSVGFLLSDLLEMGVAMSAGYFYEQWAFYTRFLGIYNWIYFPLKYVILLFSFVYFSKPYRLTHLGLSFLLIGIPLFFMVDILAFGTGYLRFDYAVTVIPGWHSTLITSYFTLEFLPFYFLIMLIVAFLFDRKG
jgi:hypothetical protein